MANSNEMSYYMGNPYLKAANVQMTYTEEQIKEMIRCAKDPLYFIENYVKIVTIDEGLVPFKLWPFQKKLINTFVNERFTIAKLPRQVGKCFDSNTIIRVRYKKKYIFEIKIGELYEHYKKGYPMCNLSEKLCKKIEKQLL